jgi:hypothetical protein
VNGAMRLQIALAGLMVVGLVHGGMAVGTIARSTSARARAGLVMDPNSRMTIR